MGWTKEERVVGLVRKVPGKFVEFIGKDGLSMSVVASERKCLDGTKPVTGSALASGNYPKFGKRSIAEGYSEGDAIPADILGFAYDFVTEPLANASALTDGQVKRLAKGNKLDTEKAVVDFATILAANEAGHLDGKWSLSLSSGSEPRLAVGYTLASAAAASASKKALVRSFAAKLLEADGADKEALLDEMIAKLG